MTTPDPPNAPGTPDAPDPRIAGWLAVEPLDATTRARLVDTAVSGATTATPSAPRRSRTPALAVAAVLVVLLAVGLAVIAARGSDEPTTRATARPSAESLDAGATDRAAPASPSPAPGNEAFSSTAALASVGELGDVSTPARLARAASASADAPATASRNAATTTVAGCALATAEALGSPVAAGRGRVDGGPATVVVVTDRAGTTFAVAVQDPDCGRTVTAVLP
jgi:hypothetical protein